MANSFREGRYWKVEDVPGKGKGVLAR